MSRDPHYFAIIGAMRTGSNLLEKTLEALGDTVCYGEVFNPTFISGPRKTELLGYTVEQRDADPIGFLEHLIAAEPDKLTGFRIFHSHNQKALEYALADPRCTPIILTRDPLESWISFLIARSTGQWMLKNPRRRAFTKVHFDPTAFERHRSDLQTHYAWVDAQLQRNDRTAVRISYTELQDPSKLQSVARRIGSSGGVPEKAPIHRQNPQPLCEKVTNYAEMCAYLGMTPKEPATGPVPSGQSMLCPDGFPVAFAPLPGLAFAPVIALFHRIEVRDLGKEKLAPPDLFEQATRAVLYPVEDPGDRPIFTVVCDPLVRLHAAFIDEVFGPGWQGSDMRRKLASKFGGIPPARGIVRGRAEFTPEQHRRHFAGFLELLADPSRLRDGALKPDWLPQAELLSEFDHSDRIQIFRHEQFGHLVHWLTDQMALPRFPRGQINGIRQAEQKSILSLEDVMVPEILERVRELHNADYEAFGYA